MTLDDVDIRDLDPKWLRNQIGIVSQEPTLFAATIYENIAYGSPGATTEDVKWAADRANATKFISKFSEGFDTYVGERGVALSGGQKQRIAIARAILKNPKILILDEATSALDTESEQQVQEGLRSLPFMCVLFFSSFQPFMLFFFYLTALDRLMAGRTVITIAHRLSTIKAANYVAVIGDGKVAEFGTHQELLSKPGGLFRRLMDRQLGIKPTTSELVVDY